MSVLHKSGRNQIVALLVLPVLVASLAGGAAMAASGSAQFSSSTVAADGTNALTVVDADLDAGDFIIATIDAASTGSAVFAAGGGQAIICIDGSACDADGATGSISVLINGLGTPGVVIVNVRAVDGEDGLDGTGDDSDLTTLVYELVDLVSLNPGRACAHSALIAHAAVASDAHSATHCAP
jgi:hypothetical protein